MFSMKEEAMTEKMIIDAYCRIRTIDQSIPDDVLDFMKNAAIEKLKQEQQVSGCILIYIGCSRWTSYGRNHAKHIAGKNRIPLCGKQYKGGALDVYHGYLSDITCNLCLSKFNEGKENEQSRNQ